MNNIHMYCMSQNKNFNQNEGKEKFTTGANNNC